MGGHLPYLACFQSSKKATVAVTSWNPSAVAQFAFPVMVVGYTQIVQYTYFHFWVGTLLLAMGPGGAFLLLLTADWDRFSSWYSRIRYRSCGSLNAVPRALRFSGGLEVPFVPCVRPSTFKYIPKKPHFNQTEKHRRCSA